LLVYLHLLVLQEQLWMLLRVQHSCYQEFEQLALLE
jgi:hypothetical protein